MLRADDRLAGGRYAPDGEGDDDFHADVMLAHGGDAALADAALYKRLELRVAAETAASRPR